MEVAESAEQQVSQVHGSHDDGVACEHQHQGRGQTHGGPQRGGRPAQGSPVHLAVAEHTPPPLYDGVVHLLVAVVVLHPLGRVQPEDEHDGHCIQQCIHVRHLLPLLLWGLLQFCGPGLLGGVSVGVLAAAVVSQQDTQGAVQRHRAEQHRHAAHHTRHQHGQIQQQELGSDRNGLSAEHGAHGQGAVEAQVVVVGGGGHGDDGRQQDEGQHRRQRQGPLEGLEDPGDVDHGEGGGRGDEGVLHDASLGGAQGGVLVHQGQVHGIVPAEPVLGGAGIDYDGPQRHRPGQQRVQSQ
mmetsp:Transcript_3987/g.5535  ORF Transcript_3987/g.5535 Transcript_3987/m.5535 type:complete len:295 (-) Transcript_3987:1455-2339(-)